MKAIVQDRYGACDQVLSVSEVPPPVPKQGEVLVRVKAAGVHADVWHAVTGMPYITRLFGMGLFKPKYPIPGTDLAGVVEGLGPGVKELTLGDEVFGESHLRLQWTNGGAFAEYVAVPETALAKKPARVSFEEAACVPTSGFIAQVNLAEGNPTQGRRALINGAAGAVGSVALQLAKAHGMHVTAVDRGDKLETLVTLGADETIDYTQQDFIRGPARYDLIFDVASTLTISNYKSALSPEGRYIRIGHEHYGARGRIFGSLPSFFLFMFMAPFSKQLPGLNFQIPSKGEVMKQLAQMLEEGHLTPRVDRIFPLEEAAQALAYLETGKSRGKILLVP